MVLCKLRDCPRAECSNPVKIQDDCCPVCPDEAGRIDEMENSPVIISQPTSSKMEDCISGGRYYLHGSTWHPVMGPFGPMDCVICQCRSGRIECQRLECPLQMPCDKPIKVTGRCCPVCPIDKVVKGPLTVHFQDSELSGLEKTCDCGALQQRQGESLNTYMAELKHLAETCDFGEFFSQVFRDRFVCGLVSSGMQKRLLTENDLTLSRATEITSSMEATEF
ncbi:hypothetical protein QYM36_008454 [Artemia franciscana]|uniref:VWFC domain-containing protein n=1 Tax=Artemia franciscana TaxID=6661 RepID=A0AA88IGX4_ARTSF|nr:hypothetical protein QYM36_008454 [Artemia franciscana]